MQTLHFQKLVNAEGDAFGDFFEVFFIAELGTFVLIGHEAAFDEDGGHGGFTDDVEVAGFDASGVGCCLPKEFVEDGGGQFARLLPTLGITAAIVEDFDAVGVRGGRRVVMNAGEKHGFCFIGNGDASMERDKDVFTAGEHDAVSHLFKIFSDEKCCHEGEPLFHEVMDFGSFIGASMSRI